MNSRALKLTVNTVTAALVFLFGFQLAWWTWQLLVPAWKNIAPPVTAAAPPLAPSLGRRLFGDADDVSTAQEPATADSGVRLKGVFAVDGRTLSAAVVNLGAKDVTVRLNQELLAGIKLVEVHAEYIVIARNGARERVDLDRFVAAPRAGNGAAPPGPPPAAIFRLNVANTGANAFSLSRQELNTVLQDPRQMNYLGRIGPGPSGGVRVEDAPPGSLSGKLGLQAGDIITAINGQPISSPGDLARIYGQFNSLTNIRAEVKRAGAPVTLNYAIQN